ncbi:MAG: hypothetical protein ACM65M_02415 [Microcoleus sp.]
MPSFCRKNSKKCDRIKHLGEGRSPFTIVLFFGWKGRSYFLPDS